MGAKAWFIAWFDDDPKQVLANKPKLDRDASRALAARMFPDMTLVDLPDAVIYDLNPYDGEIHVADYGGLRIVAHESLGLDDPAQIDPRWIDPSLGRTAFVLGTHSVVDWFAFGLWRDGRLIRALSCNSDEGLITETGDRLPFEAKYWDGSYEAELYADFEDEFEDDEEDERLLPFHPLDMMEGTMLEMLGFQFEGHPKDWICNPEDIPMLHLKDGRKPWWKIW